MTKNCLQVVVENLNQDEELQAMECMFSEDALEVSDLNNGSLPGLVPAIDASTPDEEDQILSGNLIPSERPISSLLFTGPFPQDPFARKPMEETVVYHKRDNDTFQVIAQPPLEIDQSMLLYCPLDCEVPINPLFKAKAAQRKKELTCKEYNKPSSSQHESIQKVIWETSDVNARADGEVDLWELLGGGKFFIYWPI